MRRGAARSPARLAAVFAGVLAAVSLPGAGVAETAPALDRLRAENDTLAARADRARLDLYALESQHAQARRDLARLEAEAASLGAEQARLALQRAVAQRSLAVAHRRLAALLRALYEHGDVEPLAVLFGAQSLDEALAGLDSLARAAELNRKVIAATRGARNRLARLSRTLVERQRELAGVVRAARANEVRLTSARAERAAYIAELREQVGLKRGQIAALEADAREAERRSRELTAAAPAATTAPAPTTPLRPAPGGGRELTVSSTGYALRGTTATGIQTAWGVVAVDPSVIPLGTRMTIPGYGEGVAADTGGAVHGNVIDLWFPTYEQAIAWGRRTVTITLR